MANICIGYVLFTTKHLTSRKSNLNNLKDWRQLCGDRNMRMWYTRNWYSEGWCLYSHRCHKYII